MKKDKFQLAISDISSAELKEVKDIFSSVNFNVDIYQYRTEAYGDLQEVVKIVFANFDIVAFLRDGTLWTAFQGTLLALWKLMKRMRPKKHLRGWMTVTKVEFAQSLNIILPEQEKELEAMWSELSERLKNPPSEWQGKIVWITYDASEKRLDARII